MTAQSIALGLRSKYPLPAARAKAFRKYLQWMGPSAMGRASWDAAFDEKRSRRLTLWTQVCLALDTEPSDVC